MQIHERRGKRRPRRLGRRSRGKQRLEKIGQGLSLEQRERALDQTAQRLLMQSFRRRVDGRQALGRLRLVRAHDAMLGVHELEPGRARADFAEAA